jgi:putative effector of murein hydrolase LrgA (UPF0299 family)
MLYVRGALAILLILVGCYIVTMMLRYPIAQSFTGIVLGAAMVMLGIVRLRQIREASRR